MREEKGLSVRDGAESAIRKVLDQALATNGYDGGDVRACLDAILDVLMEPSHVVYQAAAAGIPMEMADEGIVARVTAREAARAYLTAVKNERELDTLEDHDRGHDLAVRSVVKQHLTGAIDYNQASNRLAGLGVPWERAVDLLSD